MKPIYVAPSNRALTSLCEVRDGTVQIWSCTECSHVQSTTVIEARSYYESNYRISLDHDDEDQIYEVSGDQIVYRNEHQVATLLKKLDIPRNAKFLDYGCAKASTPKRLRASRNDIQFYLFDVSEMYAPYWHQFVESERCATYQTPPFWRGRFDIVTSFFALEHIPKPLDATAHIASLLVDDGIFYGIVPDMFSNFADFLVIDHVNHFTFASLHTLLRASGFKDIQIDSKVHRGALVFTARKQGPCTPHPEVDPINVQSRLLAKYWSELSDRIQQFELDHLNLPSAIYGSGFYGAYIASVLNWPDHVECFLDANPYQHNKQLFGKKVFLPRQLPKTVELLYVGLNPLIAREVISQMDWLKERSLSIFFLD